MRFLLLWTFLLFLSACQKSDDTIQTYRLSKDEGIAMNRSSASPAAEMTAMGDQLGLQAAASSDEVTWTTPAGWTEQAPSAMRVGSFLVTGANGGSADISVVPLAGDAGGDLSNINRWRGQIGLEPLAEADLEQQSTRISPAGRHMRLVDFISADAQRRIVAAIYLDKGRTWFFKITGDAQTVASAKPAFLTFLKSLRFHSS